MEQEARQLEAWLNAYWRYLEPERLLFGDAISLKAFIHTRIVPPEKIYILRCYRLHSTIGGEYLRISANEGIYICTVSLSDLQKILNDQYPQFLEGIQWYDTKE